MNEDQIERMIQALESIASNHAAELEWLRKGVEINEEMLKMQKALTRIHDGQA